VTKENTSSSTNPKYDLEVAISQTCLSLLSAWHQQEREMSITEFEAAMSFCYYDAKLDIQGRFQSAAGISDDQLEKWAEGRSATPARDKVRKFLVLTLCEIILEEIKLNQDD
jgi:hypothetical protein